MKYSAAAICLLSATLSLAAPAVPAQEQGQSGQDQGHSGQEQGQSGQDKGQGPSGPAGLLFTAAAAHKAAGFLVPTMIKSHDIASNKNTQAWATGTQRNKGIEMSTLYEFYVPPTLAGKTCSAVFYAGKLGKGDQIMGEKALDIFSSSLVGPLAQSTSGNLRDRPLGRVRFDRNTNFFEFDERDAVAYGKQFPCPAGLLVHGETVAVGDFDISYIQQDFAFDGHNIPNGLSWAYW